MSQQRKYVLVTGGTRGIGKAVVEALLAARYGVILTGTRGEGDGLLHGRNPKAVIQLRLEDGNVCEKAASHVARLLERRGGLHGLVNNASICQTASLKNERFDSVLDAVIDTNLKGTALFMHELLSHGLKPGAIVNISSQLGVVGRAGYSAYCASKAGLIALTKVWSMELAPKGCRVNAVCPGWIETEMTATDLARLAKEEGIDPALYRKRLEDSLDLRRFNTPQEVAEIVAFLLSPASSGITGRIIEMAGPSA